MDKNVQIAYIFRRVAAEILQAVLSMFAGTQSLGLTIISLSGANGNWKRVLDKERNWADALRLDFDQEYIRGIKEDLARYALPRASDEYRRLPSKHAWLAIRHAYATFLKTDVVKDIVYSTSAEQQTLANMVTERSPGNMSAKIPKYLRVTGLYTTPWLQSQAIDVQMKLNFFSPAMKNELEKPKDLKDAIDMGLEIEEADMEEEMNFVSTSMFEFKPLTVNVFGKAKSEPNERFAKYATFHLARKLQPSLVVPLLAEAVSEELLADDASFTVVINNPILRKLASGINPDFGEELEQYDSLPGFEYYKEIPRDPITGMLMIKTPAK